MSDRVSRAPRRRDRLGRNYYRSYPGWRSDPDFFSGEWNFFIVYQRYYEERWRTMLVDTARDRGVFTAMNSPLSLPRLIRKHGYGNRVFTVLGSDRPAFIGLLYVRRKMTWSECSQVFSRGCFFEPVRMTDEEVEEVLDGRPDDGGAPGSHAVSVGPMPSYRARPQLQEVYVSLGTLENGDKIVMDVNGKPYKDNQGRVLVILRDHLVVPSLVDDDDEPRRPGPVVGPEPAPPVVVRPHDEEPQDDGHDRMRDILRRHGVDYDHLEYEGRVQRWMKEREMVERRSQFGAFSISEATMQREEYLRNGIIEERDGVLYYVDPHPHTDGRFVPFTEGIDYRRYLPPRPRPPRDN